MLESVGSMPFDLQSQMQELQRGRRRIENDLAARVNEKQHSRAHKVAEALEQSRLDLTKSYDRMGKRIAFQKEQGSTVDIKV